MAYINHGFGRRRSAPSAELVYLLVVVSAGAITAWWAAQRLGADLSGIQTAADVLGFTQAVGAPKVVGYVQTNTVAASAAYCNAGEAPAFKNGIAALKRQVGNAMGAPVECEHPASAAGDTVQQTSTGLAAYDKQSNTVSFTDGWHHWALTQGGFVEWDGTEPNPPSG